MNRNIEETIGWLKNAQDYLSSAAYDAGKAVNTIPIDNDEACLNAVSRVYGRLGDLQCELAEVIQNVLEAKAAASKT
jgi:hypothetical protein